MHKKCYNKKNISWNLFLKKWVFVFVIFHFFVFFSVYATVQVTSILWEKYFKAQQSSSFDDMAWRWWVSNLFESAFEMAQDLNYSPLYEALDEVTDAVNNEYDCHINASDVSNIVLSSDDEALIFLIQAAIDWGGWPLYIPVDDVVASCHKLSLCAFPNSNTVISDCQKIVWDSFSSIWASKADFASMNWENFGSNYFQNGTLDDSDYDLMLDIKAVGELMFEWFEPPVEVLFYRMPEMSVYGEAWTDQWEINSQSTWLYDPMLMMGWNTSSSPWWIDWYSYGDDGLVQWFQCPEPWSDEEWFWWENSQSSWFESEELDMEIASLILGTQKASLSYFDESGVWTIGDACANFQECGNNVIEGTEQCDEWDLVSGDGCGSTCQIEYCGDGIRQAELWEACDDGNLNNFDACLTGCVLAVCWDNYRWPEQEWCDDGNLKNGDGCNEICEPDNSLCGNGIVDKNFGEECDDANIDDTDACLSNCQNAFCGDDSIRKWHEVCDDGNYFPWDGCSPLCEDESELYCGDGIWQEELWETCDDGDGINNNECSNFCEEAYCGDGIWQESLWEECDDWNNMDYDCCNSDCIWDDYLSPEEVVLGDILDQINNFWDEEWFDAVLNCASACNDLPLSDRILCIADCACWEVASKEMLWVIEAEAFRVRFCTIPAQDVEVTRWRRIYSIEEIFDELSNVLTALKESGWIPKSVQTKEFMDTSMSKNSFVDMFAFNLLVNQKPLFQKETTKLIEKKAEEFNQELMSSLLNVSDDIATQDPNKYVVMENIARVKANRTNIKTYEQLQEEIVEAQSALNRREQIGDEIFITIQDQKTAMINQEVMSFMDLNLSFWLTVNDMFYEILGSTELLRRKIE